MGTENTAGKTASIGKLFGGSKKPAKSKAENKRNSEAGNYTMHKYRRIISGDLLKNAIN